MPKLTHFPFHGKAEAIKLLLHKAGVKYEDNTVNFKMFCDVWGREVTRIDQLPIYEKNGKALNESNVILRHLGRKYGFYPCDDIHESYRIDSVLGTNFDVWFYNPPRCWLKDWTEKETAAGLARFKRFND